MEDFKNITVAILAGGLGTRLHSKVADKPKVVAEIRGQPFLKYIFDQLNFSGFKKVIICTGYLGDRVKLEFGNTYRNLEFIYSQESHPLGTAGAIRLALPLLKSETIMVMNGDSFSSADLKKFVKFHLQKKAKATILLTEVSDTSRYGRIDIDKKGKILAFKEKQKKSEKGLINAGVYLFNKSLLFEIPKTRVVSFEKEMFPNWINNDFYGYQTKGSFIDIGTPKSFAYAKQFFARRFVILDRDGTIIVEKDHLTYITQVELIPKVAHALKKLRSLGLGLIIITNQSVIGRGHISLTGLEKIHKRMVDLLSKQKATIDGIYFCPHTPEDNCSCRKPKLGLIEVAVKELKFDPKLCFVIGDKAIDIELGQKIRATTFLVKTGYGAKAASENIITPDYIVGDLQAAATVIEHLLNE